MKTYRIKFLVILLLGLNFTGCEKYLEQKLYTDLTSENFFGSEADFLTALVALYNDFGPDWGRIYNQDGANEWSYTMGTTDEMRANWSSATRNFTWGTTYFNGRRPYMPRLPKIALCTDVINNINNSDADADVKAQYVAEAKVIRAFYMYWLWDFFGPVNPKLDPATLTDTTIIPRMSNAEYVAAMESDLNDAIASASLQETTNDEWSMWGRFNKGVARMLLLRIYLHEKDWAKAETAAMSIVNMGYSLDPDYANVFIEKANNEVIWASHGNEAAECWLPQYFFPGGYDHGYAGTTRIERGAGWYGYAMHWDFFDKFEATDLRRNTIIYEYINTSGDTITRDNSSFRGAIPLKYTGITGPGPDYPIDLVVFRYAEVLLSLAEAINNQRGPAEAYQYVNAVRARAGVADYAGLTQAELNDSLLDERGRELYLECTRRADLIRHGKFIEYALARGVTNAQPHHVLFPIPNSVIIEGGGIIEQNPGY
jgi:starch-binding outer membrane protein, SusD/RagB family